MSIEHIVFLALVQGVTEFIPVSSSGHLVLGHQLNGGAQTAAALSLDVALHLGTLAAVMVYFRSDVAQLLGGLVQLAKSQPGAAADAARRMIWATVPILGIAALLVATDAIDTLRQPHIVAWASILFAIPLFLADRYGGNAPLSQMTDKSAAVMGLAQILALIPGASRAGVTIMAGRALGFDRTTAAHYSMLMAMPVIVCFALVGLVELIAANAYQALGHAALGAVLAAGFAFITIDVFLRLTRAMSLWPFVIYRIGLGVAILALA